MRKTIALLVVLCAMLCLLPGCGGGKKNKTAAVKPSGFASADAKNIHDFINRFPDVAAGGDAQAMLRLLTEDARYVPLLGKVVRPIRGAELEKQLPAVLAEERRMGLELRWREPMDIQAKGERASVRAVADMRWKEGGQAKQAVMSCYFGLVRDENLLWRIREFHGEPVGPSFRLPAQAQPAQAPAKKPLRREKLVIKGEPPKPAAAPPAQRATPQPAPQQQPQPASQEKPPYNGPLVEDSPTPLF
jgi:ketosteroid isomerase-like protein